MTPLLAAAFAASAGSARADDSSLAFHERPGTFLPFGVRLQDASGATEPLKSLFGRLPVLLVMDYLRCRSLCTVTMRNLIGSLKKLPLEPGRDYELVSVSVDPRDTPADAAKTLAQDRALFGRPVVGSGIQVLVGRAKATHRLAQAVGFPYRYDPLFDAYIHPTGLVAVAPNGMISRYLEGVDPKPSDLVAAVAAAQQDRSLGVVARVLVLCHLGGLPKGGLVVPVLAAFTGLNLLGGAALAVLFTVIRRRRHG